MIKNIIFDFGGVILKHRTTIMEEFISQMFSIPNDQADIIWSKYKTSLMTGKLTSKQFIDQLKIKLSSPKTTNELLTQWKTLYDKEANNVDWALLDYIEKLKKRYWVYLFTDTIDIHDEYNQTRGIYDKFNQVFKSFKEGLAKSSGGKAYLNVLKKINAKPKECIFIDDLEVNIKTAQQLGIKGILYTNLQNLKKSFSLQEI